MALAIATQSRIALVASIMALCVSWTGVSHAEGTASLPAYVIEQYGEPPEIPDGPLSDSLKAAVNAAFVDSIKQSAWGRDQTLALNEVADSKDPRLVWIISDLMRFTAGSQLSASLTDAASKLLRKKIPQDNNWGVITDHLIAWDIPEPPDYLAVKRGIFTTIVPGWDRIFVDGDIDWRHVSWGGVLIDNRAYDTTDEICNCIPAADNPEVSSAEDATWLKDDDIVFGIGVNGEYRAYPRRIMEVRGDGQRHSGWAGSRHSLLHALRRRPGLLHRPVA